MVKKLKGISSVFKIILIGVVIAGFSIPGYSFMKKLNKAAGKSSASYPEWSVNIPWASSSHVSILPLGEDGTGRPQGKVVDGAFVITASSDKNETIRIEVPAANPKKGKQYKAKITGQLSEGGKLSDGSAKKQLTKVKFSYLIKFTELGDGFSKGVIILDMMTSVPFKVEVVR